MKSFQNDINIISSTQNTPLAGLLMDVVPLIMSRIRSEMRSNRTPGLSIPQFRTLIYLYRHKNATLSQVAEHIGLKLPSTSKIVEALVTRDLIIRNQSPEDRRCIRLSLSPGGTEALMRTRHTAESHFCEILSGLSGEQQAGIASAIQALYPLFASPKDKLPKYKNTIKDGTSNKAPGDENGR